MPGATLNPMLQSKDMQEGYLPLQSRPLGLIPSRVRQMFFWVGVYRVDRWGRHLRQDWVQWWGLYYTGSLLARHLELREWRWP